MRVLPLCGSGLMHTRSPVAGIKIKYTGKAFEKIQKRQEKEVPGDQGDCDVITVRAYDFRPKTLTALAKTLRDDQ